MKAKKTKAKIKPLDKNESKKMIAKVIFLALIIFLGFILSTFFKPQKPVEPAKDKQILGEAADEEKASEIKKTLNLAELEKKAKETKDFILGETTSLVEKSKTAVQEEVSSAVYQTTLKPIVDQINRLPADQQERIREQICK